MIDNELIHFLQQPDGFALPKSTPLYTTAYRPQRLASGDQIEMWLEPLGVGQP